MSADSDRAAAYLAEVADLIAKRDTLARSAGAFCTPQDVDEFNAAQDRLAARAAPLAAAVEAVLALADEWDEIPYDVVARLEAAQKVRQAITAELPGESRPGLRETGEPGYQGSESRP